MSDRRHCACIFESTSGPPVQWCSHHAMLRKENERLRTRNKALEAVATEAENIDEWEYRLRQPNETPSLPDLTLIIARLSTKLAALKETE